MIIKATDAAIPLAVEMLRQGHVIALPTETVYGLAGDASRDDCVHAIYRIKARPAINPLIAHVSSLDMAQDYVEIDPLSQRLIQAFWPGPLTLILPRKANAPISSLASSGLPSLAVRQPCGIFARIVENFGRPLVAPSANRSGRISPTRAADVVSEFGNALPLIVDGGACTIGLESTIVKVVGNEIFMLRSGGLSRTHIENFLGQSIKYPATNPKIEAPGMLSSHYAPHAQLRLNVESVEAGENLLAFGQKRAANYQKAQRMLNLSACGDLNQAATHLFDYLRQLDDSDVIAVEPIPHEGLGEAINDRLRRASAPRPLPKL